MYRNVALNAYGEMVSTEWVIQERMHFATMFGSKYDRSKKLSVLVRLPRRHRPMYSVCVPGFGHLFRPKWCHTSQYAEFILCEYNKGRGCDDTPSESLWLTSKARPLTRHVDVGARLPHVFLYQGILIRRFGDDVSATAWDKWYKARRKVKLSYKRPHRESALSSYRSFRSNEMLDKEMDDRVYELVLSLTGQGDDPE